MIHRIRDWWRERRARKHAQRSLSTALRHAAALQRASRESLRMARRERQRAADALSAIDAEIVKAESYDAALSELREELRINEEITIPTLAAINGRMLAHWDAETSVEVRRKAVAEHRPRAREEA